MPNRHDWLVKALSEGGGELRVHAETLGPTTARWPTPDGDSMIRLLAEALDGEVVAVHLAEQLAFRPRARLTLHEREWLAPGEAPPRGDPGATADRLPSFDDLLDGFLRHRRRLCHLLMSIEASDWTRSARHPFRGEITITTLVEERHRATLEQIWRAQRIAETFLTRDPHPSR